MEEAVEVLVLPMNARHSAIEEDALDLRSASEECAHCKLCTQALSRSVHMATVVVGFLTIIFCPDFFFFNT